MLILVMGPGEQDRKKPRHGRRSKVAVCKIQYQRRTNLVNVPRFCIVPFGGQSLFPLLPHAGERGVGPVSNGRRRRRRKGGPTQTARRQKRKVVVEPKPTQISWMDGEVYFRKK